MDEGDPSECPVCGGYAIYYECWDCGGDGYRELYDDDPLWYDEDDTETCSTCNGDGHWWVCKSACAEKEQAA